MQLFKALQHLTCEGKDYAPGEILPGASSFPNLKELIEWRYIGYPTIEEIAAYEAKQAELAEQARIAQEEAAAAAKQAELEPEQVVLSAIVETSETNAEESNQKDSKNKPPK